MKPTLASPCRAAIRAALLGTLAAGAFLPLISPPPAAAQSYSRSYGGNGPARQAPRWVPPPAPPPRYQPPSLNTGMFPNRANRPVSPPRNPPAANNSTIMRRLR